MRNELTRERILALMDELARTSPKGRLFRVYLTGGGTAVLLGWRMSSVDIDLSADHDEVFRDVQAIKERLGMNIEFARPDDFVPALNGQEERHVFIDRFGSVLFYHFDPYAQLLSKIVRGFQRDLEDARQLVRSGLVVPAEFQALAEAIPDSAYSKYPHLSRTGIESAVRDFLAHEAGSRD